MKFVPGQPELTRLKSACPGSRLWVLLAAVLMVSSAHAAIDGVVTNATTGKPQEGSTVNLLQMTTQGPQSLGSVKTDAQGKFVFTQNVQPGVGGGPILIQAVYDGVEYNKAIAPGMATSGVAIPVYQSTKMPADAKIEQHFFVLEPSPDGTLTVNEGFVYKNDGKTTWNDPDRGTLQFELPAAAQGKVEVSVLAPGGQPVRRPANPLGKPNQFKVDFPIKPGESRVDLAWQMPFNSPGVFEDHVLSKSDVLRVVAPHGVEFKASDVVALGEEPTSKATIYSVKGPDVEFVIQGTGLFNQQQDDQSGGGQNQSLSENMPKLYGMISSTASFGESVNAVKWVLATVLGMLALGFILLYRKGNPVEEQANTVGTRANPSQISATKASEHARGRG